LAISTVNVASLEFDPMKILLVFAHPEPRSLHAALRDVAIGELEAQGHEVRLSDLYAENWKSEVDRADFPLLATDARLKVAPPGKSSPPTGLPKMSAPRSKSFYGRTR
jgi:NAD(P)H dehydrogenase (quinone)